MKIEPKENADSPHSSVDRTCSRMSQISLVSLGDRRPLSLGDRRSLFRMVGVLGSLSAESGTSSGGSPNLAR